MLKYSRKSAINMYNTNRMDKEIINYFDYINNFFFLMESLSRIMNSRISIKRGITRNFAETTVKFEPSLLLLVEFLFI